MNPLQISKSPDMFVTGAINIFADFSDNETQLLGRLLQTGDKFHAEKPTGQKAIFSSEYNAIEFLCRIFKAKKVQRNVIKNQTNLMF